MDSFYDGKDSNIIDDFYTNSIAEADCSVNEEIGVSQSINQIPRPFVKQETTLKDGKQDDNPKEESKGMNDFKMLRTVSNTPSKVSRLNEISISNSYEFALSRKKENKNKEIYKEYLHMARKGDKEGFLSSIEK